MAIKSEQVSFDEKFSMPKGVFEQLNEAVLSNPEIIERFLKVESSRGVRGFAPVETNSPRPHSDYEYHSAILAGIAFNFKSSGFKVASNASEAVFESPKGKLVMCIEGFTLLVLMFCRTFSYDNHVGGAFCLAR